VAPRPGAATLAEHRTTLSLRGTIILCALSGVALSLCFPPAGLWFLAWGALVPWLLAIRLSRGPGILLASWVGGIVFFGALCYWLYLFGVSVLLLASLLLGLYPVAWAALSRWAGRIGPLARMLGAAVFWCGIEWVRGLGQFGFTWGWLGYSQAPKPGLLPIARLAGTLGISFVIVLMNAGLAEFLVGVLRRERLAGPAVRTAICCGLAALCVLGARQWGKGLPEPSGPEIGAAVVQGSAHGPLTPADVNLPLTPQEQARTLDVYGSLTAQAAQERPALVVWPESVIPGPPEAHQVIATRVSQIARSSGAWLLAGGPYEDEAGRPYNSAYLYSPTGNLTSRYDKVQLVPFGEYVPWRTRLPFLHRYHVRELDFTPGAVQRVLQAGTIAIGPMICFESIFPNIAWQLTHRKAQVLVIITNDAWFGHTAAAAQHAQIAVLRAMETGRYVLRGASTGISSIIAPNGRMVAQAGLYQRQVLSARVRLATETSPLLRGGPAFSWGVVALSVALAIAPAARTRGRGKGPTAQPPPRPRRRGRAAPR